MEKEYIDFFSKTFLFSGLTSEKIIEITNKLDMTVRSFDRLDVIYSQTDYQNELGIVIDGECTVCRIRKNSSRLPLNTLKKYGSFGITAIFSSESTFPTEIYAKKSTKVVFISRKSLLSAINRYPTLAMNIITFLTGRVEFLNKKIATLTSCGADEKLASLLLAEYKKVGNTEFHLNCKAASEVLGIGRASLYRAIKALSDEGVIEYVDKKIYIKKPDELKGITK